MHARLFTHLGLALLAATATATATAAAACPQSRRVVVPERAAPAELRRDWIPADSTLVLHFDMEAFKATSLWKYVEAHPDDFDLEDGFHEMQEELGLDPRRDIRSITVFSSEPEPEPGAVLLVTSARVDQALERWKEEHSTRNLSHEGVELTAAEDEDFFVSIQELRNGDRAVVLSDDMGTAAHTALVLRGREPSLADVDSPLRAEPRSGSFLYLETARLPWLQDFKPASQVFGLAQGIQFDLGEAGGSLFGHLSLLTESPAEAMDLADAVKGIMALGRILLSSQEEIPPELQDLMRSLDVNVRGSQVTVDFEYDVQALAEILRSLEDE